MPPEVKQGIFPPFSIKKSDYMNFIFLVISEFFIQTRRMARHNGFVFNDETLSTPPPIEGIEVSAKWKRTWKGEVIMTVMMPFLQAFSCWASVFFITKDLWHLLQG